jgi:RHS repeat-associated protein
MINSAQILGLLVVSGIFKTGDCENSFPGETGKEKTDLLQGDTASKNSVFDFGENLEYFPYGETWVHNKATSDASTTLSNRSTPYKFTSKELDEETGWYYYGHRYLDPKLSDWISADPPLAKGEYFPVPPINDKAKERNSKLPGMGGVFNSINLDAYQYAGRNPVKFVDPDGKDVAILLDREAAKNYGHSAMAIFENGGNGKVTYISYGPESSGKPMVKEFTNKAGFFKFLEESTYGNNPEKGSGFKYDGAEVFKTDATQDANIIKEGKAEISKNKWTLLGNMFGNEYDDPDVNCKDAVRNSLGTGGKLDFENRVEPNNFQDEVVKPSKLERNEPLQKQLKAVLRK